MEQWWPCGNCGATSEFGPDGCSNHNPIKLALNHYCGSYRADMGVQCSCDYGMDRRGDLFVCRNCHGKLTIEQVRSLVAKYGEALTSFAATLAVEGESASVTTSRDRC